MRSDIRRMGGVQTRHGTLKAGCNTYCDPDENIHAEVGWGDQIPVGKSVFAHIHGQRGRAIVISDDPATEVPTPEKYEDWPGPWLLVVRFRDER